MEQQYDIKKAYEELNPKIRKIIVNSNWEAKISLIVKKHNLRIDQGSALEKNTLLVMLGLISVSDFIYFLKEEVEIKEQSTIDSLVSEIEEEVFKKIRETLINSVGGTKTEEVVVKENDVMDRESILKEIEKEEEDETELAIPTQPSVPSTQVNTIEQNQKIVAQDLKNTAPNTGATNTVAQKLQTPSVSQPKVVKIDPYRESF